MTQPVTTRADLLGRSHDAYRDFSAAVAAIPSGMLTTPGTIGTWSVRDVIAHVGADEQWMAGQLEALQSNSLPTPKTCYGDDTPPPADMDWNSQDARNAWQRERLRDLSLDEVRSMAAEAHARLLAVIATLDDAQLAEDLTIGENGTVGQIRRPNAGEQAWPLWQWLRGVTYAHYADHADALRTLGAPVNQQAATSDQRPA